MLKKSNVASVVSLAQQLQDRGYQLTLNPKFTLLDAVMRANEVNYVVATDSLEDVLVNRSAMRVVDGVALEDGEETPVLIPNAHTQAMDELTTAAASAITVISNLVRTHINPNVANIAQAVYRVLDGNAYSDITDFGYETRAYNPIYNSGVVEGLISGINTAQALPLPTVNLPAMNNTQLENLVKTANASINSGLATFQQKYADGLVYVYDLFFRQSGGPNPLSASIYTTRQGDNMVNLGSGSDTAVPAVGLIIAAALVDNPPEGTTLDVDVYNGLVSRVMSALANAVKMVSDERAFAIEQKILVLEYPMISSSTGRVNGKMVLNDDMTSSFYGSGISMDELIGSALSSRYTSLDELLINKDRLVEIYRAHRDQAMVNRTINRQQFLNSALVEQISNYFDDVDPAILEPTVKAQELANKGELRLLVLNKVRDDLYHTRVLENNIQEYLTTLFAERIFINPSLGDFLRIFNTTEMYGVARNNEEESIRERAAYTAIIMLTKLFSEATTVKRL